MRTIEIPNLPPLELTHLVFDVNGTLTKRGELIEGVAAELGRIRETLEIHLLSADTFGSLARIASTLGIAAVIADDGAEKAAYVRQLGSQNCVAIGNGANDESMLREAALGIAVVGPEGVATSALAAADIVCTSIADALELLGDERALAATLRP